MKKLLTVLLSLTLIAALFTGCASSSSSKTSSSQKKYRIGIIQPMEHPSLTTIYHSIADEIKALGLSDRIEITYKNAQGDPSNITAIVNEFVGEKMDMIVPIGTAPAQACVAATKTIPIVFSAVSYPVEAKVVTSFDNTDGNVTGVSNAIAVEDIFDLAKTLTPNVKTYGFIYNAGEVNSASGIVRAKTYCDSHGLKYLEKTITNTSELAQAVQSLESKVDAFFTPNDNTVASAMPVYAAEGIKAKVPVYVGADSMVQDGGFATVGIDYTVLGKQTAQMIKRILIDGQTIKQNHVELINQYAKMVNTTTADKIGVMIPDSLLSTFKTFK